MLFYLLLVVFTSSALSQTYDQCSASRDSSTKACASDRQQSFATRFAECRQTPECGEGPYFIEEDIIRKDLIEDRVGHPLKIKFNVLDHRTCSPISKAKLHIWHPDYSGIYSGFMDRPPVRRGRMRPRDDRRFLRGTQITDFNGTVEFNTLFPGHYPGRTPHIHFRVHLNDSVAHIGQVFFEEEILAFVNSRPPYNQVRTPRIRSEEDGEFSHFDGQNSIINLKPENQLSGVMNLVIDPLHKSTLMWA